MNNKVGTSFLAINMQFSLSISHFSISLLMYLYIILLNGFSIFFHTHTHTHLVLSFRDKYLITGIEWKRKLLFDKKESFYILFLPSFYPSLGIALRAYTHFHRQLAKTHFHIYEFISFHSHMSMKSFSF